MEINKPMTTRNMLASTLTDYRKPSSCSRCEEMERRLSDIRKANGGHMFAGARAGS